VPGRIYAIGCKCGHTIVVKGPDVSGGVRNGGSPPVREDPFAEFHGKYQLPPVQAPTRSSRGAQAPAFPSGLAEPGRHAGALARPLQAPWQPPPPAPPAAAPEPQPFDREAAGHGLLLEVEEARALSSGSISTESLTLPPGQEDDEVSITFSERLPLTGGEGRRRWLVAAAAAFACLVVIAGSLALLSRRPAASPPPPGAQARPSGPSEAAPAQVSAAPPVAVDPRPEAAAPQGPAPATPAPKPAPVAVAKPALASAAEALPKPVRAPRPARKPSAPPVVTAEPGAAPGDPSASPALLDLLSRKADAQAAVAPRPERETRGATPGVPEVQAVLERNRSTFDACVEEAGPEASLSGRHVFLAVTVNPSGIVTSPRLDDAGLDGSPAGTCLKSAARKLVLAPFAGEPVRVRVPMTLAP